MEAAKVNGGAKVENVAKIDNADGTASIFEGLAVPLPEPVLSEHAPKFDTAIAVASEAAEELAQKFYSAIAGQRDTIASYYVPQGTIQDIKVPTILFNGNEYASGQEFEKMITEHEELSFELDTLDAHPINKVYITPDGKDPGAAAAKGRHMTVIVTVTGNCKIGDPEQEDDRTFHDSIILVPNLDYEMQKKKGKTAREFLIQTHNFRFVTG